MGLDLESVVDLCRAYEPLLREGEAFSHQTAALLFGAPLPHPLSSPGPLHVVSPDKTRARSVGVVGHRSTNGVHVVERLGLPVVAPETAWLQLAPSMLREDLTAVGDFLVTGRRHGAAREGALSTVSILASKLERNRGCRGAKTARWALERIRVGAASRPETLLRLAIVAAGLPEPCIGWPVAVGNGLTLHPDLAYPDLRIAIEYEGARHRDADRWERDIERRELFEDEGWRVIRVTRHALFDAPDALIARIRRARIASGAR
ncbi:endonuclease domain-containing protein [Agromyces sp. Leaf222]|uniref:endonuclease domain-containing protein n=1 Tax=Agromyces sp. Leaf222 TaxID=1735688 RepID=UPI0006FD1B8C|nr:DUF559 domain-containing protein [Agromyces sp. Leaf222]KQM82993.1 hypothetical protein ASE68_06790 [Agromyces sp. Leaf222]